MLANRSSHALMHQLSGGARHKPYTYVSRRLRRHFGCWSSPIFGIRPYPYSNRFEKVRKRETKGGSMTISLNLIRKKFHPSRKRAIYSTEEQANAHRCAPRPASRSLGVAPTTSGTPCVPSGCWAALRPKEGIVGSLLRQPLLVDVGWVVSAAGWVA